MAVTLAEIAALAGVSRGTVDRALNDRGRVDPKVAARVRRIAAERGYRPNRAGRMLARAKNPIRIGVIVQSVETMFMHTVFEEIERASAHFTTTGAEGARAAAGGRRCTAAAGRDRRAARGRCAGHRAFSGGGRAGARPYSGAVRAHAGRYLQLGSAGLGPPVLRRRGQFRVRTHERRSDGPAARRSTGKSCWLPVRENNWSHQQRVDGFQARLPQIFPV